MADSAPEWADGENCYRLLNILFTFKVPQTLQKPGYFLLIAFLQDSVYIYLYFLDAELNLEFLLANIIVVLVDKSSAIDVLTDKCFFRALVLKRKCASVRLAFLKVVKIRLRRLSKK
jgi:hypothetical protein